MEKEGINNGLGIYSNWAQEMEDLERFAELFRLLSISNGEPLKDATGEWHGGSIFLERKLFNWPL